MQLEKTKERAGLRTFKTLTNKNIAVTGGHHWCATESRTQS